MLKRMSEVVALSAVALAGCAVSDEPDEFGAQVMCEDFVEDRLKSPGSADFGDWTRSEVDSDTWKVSGRVDSDNSFGASIRNTFSCTISYEGDDVWQLDDLEFSGN